MVDPLHRIRGRLPEQLLINHGHRRITVTEDRHGSWANLFTAGIVCALLAGAIMVWQRREPEMVRTIAILCGLLFGVPLTIAALLVYPWNRRVVLDARDGLCSIHKRFYTVPYWSSSFSLWHGSVEVAQVVHARYDTVPKERKTGGLGCLAMLLGPIGVLFAGVALINSVQRIEQTAWALVYRDTRSDQDESHVLITCRTDRTLREAEAVYADWLQE